MRNLNHIDATNVSWMRRVQLGNIEPKGWIRQQLIIYAEGLLGSLEEIWEDVGPSNAWKGGSGDSWERGPYYLDGLVPMVFLLHNTSLHKKMQRWIDALFASQTEDGNFGPCQNDDWWPRMVMLKALNQYADGMREPDVYKKVEAFIHKYLVYVENNIQEKPFEMWAYVRGGELCSTILWMYERLGKVCYLELARKVLANSLDWKSFFSSFPFPLRSSSYIPWESFQQYISRFNNQYEQPMNHRRRDDPFFRIFHQTHGVNIAMGIKYLAYASVVNHDTEYIEIMHRGYEELCRFHGQVNGLYSCDEHLNGTSPSQGTELCTVVEMLFSLEEIIRFTNDFSWVDLWEKIAYNALFATIAGDGCSHQYDQQVNQISCTVEARQWYNNLDDSNIFGLEPNFGCCTANMHQGLPKFVTSQWLTDENSIIALSYAPVSFIHTMNGTTISITVESLYPFLDTVSIALETSNEKDFILKLHKPFWAKDMEVLCDGEKIDTACIESQLVILDRCWKSSHIIINFKMSVRFERNVQGLTIWRGPLLFALPIQANRTKLVDRSRFSDWELRPVGEWAYGILENSSGSCTVKINCLESNSLPTFNKEGVPPISLMVVGQRITNWKECNNSAGSLPEVPEVLKNSISTITLVPYGWTDLRIGLFPMLCY